MWFIANFCVIANGAYIATAWLSGDRYLDTPKLLQHGAYPMTIALYCVVTIGFGYVGFRRSCVQFFGQRTSGMPQSTLNCVGQHRVPHMTNCETMRNRDAETESRLKTLLRKEFSITPVLTVILLVPSIWLACNLTVRDWPGIRTLETYGPPSEAFHGLVVLSRYVEYLINAIVAVVFNLGTLLTVTILFGWLYLRYSHKRRIG